MEALVYFLVRIMKRVCRGLILSPEVKTLQVQVTLGEKVNSVLEVKTSPVQVTSKAASGVMMNSEVASGVMNSEVALGAALLVRASRAASRGTLEVKVLREGLLALSRTRVVSDLMKASAARMISNREANKVE